MSPTPFRDKSPDSGALARRFLRNMKVKLGLNQLFLRNVMEARGLYRHDEAVASYGIRGLQVIN